MYLDLVNDIRNTIIKNNFQNRTTLKNKVKYFFYVLLTKRHVLLQTICICLIIIRTCLWRGLCCRNKLQ